jgi:hypothetical protein
MNDLQLITADRMRPILIALQPHIGSHRFEDMRRRLYPTPGNMRVWITRPEECRRARQIATMSQFAAHRSDQPPGQRKQPRVTFRMARCELGRETCTLREPANGNALRPDTRFNKHVYYRLDLAECGGQPRLIRGHRRQERVGVPAIPGCLRSKVSTAARLVIAGSKAARLMICRTHVNCRRHRPEKPRRLRGFSQKARSRLLQPLYIPPHPHICRNKLN